MRYKLAQPVRIGDLDNFVLVDEFVVRSISVTFEPQEPVLSVVLVHPSTGWTHNVVYRDSSAAEFWARTMQSEFDLIVEAALGKMAADGKLPPGGSVAVQRGDE